MRRWAVAAAGVWATAMLAATPALAEEEEAQGTATPTATEVAPVAPHFGGQRTTGFGPTISLYSGLGGLVALGTSDVELWLSGGYMPVLIFANERNSTKDVRTNYYTTAQANADVAIRVLHPSSRLDVFAMLGYKFNTVLGHGLGAGVAVRYDLSATVAALLQIWGFSIFPQATTDRLVTDHDYPTDRDPVLPWLAGGTGVG